MFKKYTTPEDKPIWDMIESWIDNNLTVLSNPAYKSSDGLHHCFFAGTIQSDKNRD